MDVKIIINEQFPDLAIHTIKKLGEGMDSVAYLINEGYVFKFPKRKDVSENLLKEYRVLKQIAGQLPLAVPDPRYFGNPCETFPYYFMGYPKIPGVFLTEERYQQLSSSQKENVAKDLAHFLKSLHATQLKEFVPDLEQDMRKNFTYEAEQIKKLIAPALEEPQLQEISAEFDKAISDTELFADKQCLCHHDLSGDHLLMDAQSGRLLGVIDFGDVALTDADYDFYYLLTEYDGLGERVLHYYGHPNPARVIKKANFHEKFYDPFQEVSMGAAFGLDELAEEALQRIKNRQYQTVL